MVEPHFEQWDRLLFRDYLIDFPPVAREYEQLKTRLAEEHPNDREAYTNGKTEYITEITRQARRHYGKTKGLELDAASS